MRKGSYTAKTGRQTCGSETHSDIEKSSPSSVTERPSSSWSVSFTSSVQELPTSDGVSPADEWPGDETATWQGLVLSFRIPMEYFMRSPDLSLPPDEVHARPRLLVAGVEIAHRYVCGRGWEWRRRSACTCRHVRVW